MWPHLSLALFLPLINCDQLLFPSDNFGNVASLSTTENILLPSNPVQIANLTELRGTAEYDQRIDNIISSGILRLTLAIQKAIAENSKATYDNVVYAPVSIAAALALVLLGSSGKTFHEIASVMGLATGVDIHNRSQLVHEQFGRMLHKLQMLPDDGQINFATAVFVQNGFPIRDVYRDVSKMVYGSEIQNVDFLGNSENAQHVMNNWVSQKTNGKITQLLNEPPTGETKVILASTMYFKAMWEKPFFDGSSRRRPFHTNGRDKPSQVSVEMMSNGGNFPYFKDFELNCEVLGLPYKGNLTTMYIVMPNNSNKERLKELESKLTPAHMERLTANVRYTGVVLLFPKMRIDSTIDLRKSLYLMGVRKLFEPSQANLAVLSPGMTTTTSSKLENITPQADQPTEPPSPPPPSLKVSSPPPPSSSSMAAEQLPAINEQPNMNDVVIFPRHGEEVNCTSIFSPDSPMKMCQEMVNGTGKVVYKKFGNKVGRRVTRRSISTRLSENLDNIRQNLNEQGERFENPGLYVDTVIHKVYMDVTESGTEAAAATSVSLSRDGGRVTFRVDVPFFFFIMNEQSKTILFYGSVSTPSPHFSAT